MNWFNISIICLIILYIIIPIPLTKLIENYFFKTKYLTLFKTTIIWFISNTLTFIVFVTIVWLIETLADSYLDDYQVILIYSISLLALLTLSLKILLKGKFQLIQALSIAGLYVLFWGIITSSMFGLHKYKQYRDKYANAVYANSATERKKEIFDDFLYFTKLKLPDSTSLIFANCPKFFCGAMKIKINQEDMLEFEAQLKEKHSNLYSELKTTPLNEGERARWKGWGPKRFWNPLSAKNFKTANIPDLDIFIDLDDEKEVFIYIIY